MKHWGAFWLKPVTDEQVFYDKFLCDKFYLPSARVYNVTNFIWQVFIWQVLFTGVNVSTSLLWQFISSQQCNSTADNASARKDAILNFYFWPITSNAQTIWQVFFVDPYRRTKFVLCLWQFFLWQEQVLVIEKLSKYKVCSSVWVKKKTCQSNVRIWCDRPAPALPLYYYYIALHCWLLINCQSKLVDTFTPLI
jgi:hypothetical protein